MADELVAGIEKFHVCLEAVCCPCDLSHHLTDLVPSCLVRVQLYFQDRHCSIKLGVHPAVVQIAIGSTSVGDVTSRFGCPEELCERKSAIRQGSRYALSLERLSHGLQ
ncbi:hypothetical protein [Streptomyces coffeae]|uniref:Uncharacterized protein n=1 Tax=Streptomyces coffeae TaxID=621382 RepID=A0ABS1N7B3_9ACTN|nr:hypothetical protein [Streptomyces coffeae]MBL1095938.1 hypothetical protein [Streptomyces coffeae]